MGGPSFLSHGGTLAFPGEDFALRGSICKAVPRTEPLSSFLCKIALWPLHGRIEWNLFPGEGRACRC